MRKVIFALIALAISLFGTQCWAAAKVPASPVAPPVPDTCTECAPTITNTFSPGVTRGVYDFTNTGDGYLVVDFDAVLTTFSLTVTVNHSIDALDPTVFPEGTVCVQYSTNSGLCDQYDFTGNKSGPNGVPVKNIDYKRLITLTLSYASSQAANNPAFGHAPGDNTTAVYSEDILTSYSTVTSCAVLSCDPTMGGKTPGLSSITALAKPLESADTFCFVSPQQNQTFTVGQEIEVEFRLFASGVCPNGSGAPLRDKTARLSLSTTDTNGNVIFPRLRNKEAGNKFHFDHKDGVNEADLSTHKLLPGRYTVNIYGSNFSPQKVDINIVAGTDTDDDPD